MKKLYMFGTSAVIIVLLIGCGSGSGVATATTNTSGPIVKVTTKAQAEKAASAVGSINGFATNASTSSSSSSTSTTTSAPLRAISRASVNLTSGCSGGGSIVTSGNADSTSANILITYSNCSESGAIISGTVSTVGTNNGGLVNLQMTMKNLEYKLSSSSYYKMNLVLDYKTSDTYSLDLLYSGTVEFSMPKEGSGSVGFDNFHILIDNSSALDMSGKISMNNNINTCQNGIYNIKTIQPLIASYSGYSSGTMVVNGATYVYNNDGTADVTFADGSKSTITQGAAVVCN